MQRIPPDELRALTGHVSRLIGYVDIVPAGVGAPSSHRCHQILAAQDAGGDPTGAWRDDVARAQAAYYAAPVKRHVGAAFVLGWYLSVVANPAAYAAVASPWVLDVAPERLAFDLDGDAHYPCAVAVDGIGARMVADPALRIERARASYGAHAGRFLAGYRPGVKMSSLQREGMARDVWRMALESATLAVHGTTASPWLRESCCLIVALPGARACEKCPQRRRPVAAS